MDFTRKSAMSYYSEIAEINMTHHISLVQHRDTKKIYVKKVLDVYNPAVYEYLYDHPIEGTPRIINYFEDGHQLTVIEEYISGSTLEEIMHSDTFTRKDALDYMLDLCSILEQLHGIRPAVIHRDIKPSNVIITNYHRAVLLDFNAAKYYSSAAMKDTTLLGTEGYAAPEQYGFGASSPQTDIYALGILFREMLNAADETTDALEAIINRCTQLDPSKRFRSVSELKNVLQAYAQPKKTTADIHSKAMLTPPGFRTGKPWKMLLAVLGYLLIIYVSFTLEIIDASVGSLWTQRVFCFAILLSVVLICTNYLDIRRVMPLCRSTNPSTRVMGIIFLNVITVFTLLFMLTVIVSVFFQM